MQGPVKRRPAHRNLIALDGTLDRALRIHIKIHETGRDASPFDIRIQHRDAVHEYVDCSNPACFNGGFSLGNLLREMASARQEEYIGTNFCAGQEGDPEEPGPHPSCATRFEVEAILRFR